MTLTDFLLARIAEDEENSHDATAMGAKSLGEHVAACVMGATPQGVIAAPARVLAECEAKRRIVRRHSTCDDTSFGEPCEDLRDIASVYADHPDYREEWKP